MKIFPSISVIVPIYKAEKFLHRCIDSLLMQTFKDFELLLIDDGSPDQSGALCEEYAQKDCRVKVFHKENGGVGSSRQLGLENAQGEYLIYVDSDDWVELTYLEDLYVKAKENKADIVFCDFNRVYANRVQVECVNPPQNSQDCIIAMLYGRLHAALWNKLIRRDLYKQHDIQFIPGLNIMEDLAVLVRLAYFAQHFAYVDKKLYNYNKMNEEACTLNIFNDQHCENYLVLEKKIFNFFKIHPCSSKVRYAVQQKYVSLVAATLFYASTGFLQQHCHYLRDYTVKDVLFHPTLSMHYKLMALFNILRMNIFVKCLRKITRVKK